MKVVLKTNVQHKFGVTNVLPIAGEVKFNDEGQTTVEIKSKEDLDVLLVAVPDLIVEGYMHTVTADDIEANPELTDAGVKAGDEVMLPNELEDEIKPQVDENDLGKGSEEDENTLKGTPDSTPLEDAVTTTVITGTLVTDKPDAGIGEGTQLHSEGSDKAEPITNLNDEVIKDENLEEVIKKEEPKDETLEIIEPAKEEVKETAPTPASDTDVKADGKEDTKDNDIAKVDVDSLLKGKNVTELKDLAKDFPAAEWEALTKPKLIEYLKEKLSAK